MWGERCSHVFVYGITYFTGFLSITLPSTPKPSLYDESPDHRHGVFSHVWDIDEDTGGREIKGIKEQEVYMGDIPLMTKKTVLL